MQFFPKLSEKFLKTQHIVRYMYTDTQTQPLEVKDMLSYGNNFTVIGAP